MTRRVLAIVVLLALPTLARAQQPATVQAIDPSTNTVAPKVGDVTNSAIRMVCIDPVTHLVAACGGGGTASSVTINDPNTTSQKAAVNASGQLSITCANCSGSGASAVDESTFTQGTNSVAPAGILFKTSYTALTTGQTGILRGFSDGSLFSMGNVASGATDTGNPLKIGSLFNTTQPTVTNGQRVDAQMTARGGLIVATGADTFNVTVNAALPAGSAVIGHVIADSGSTTAVTGNVTVIQGTGTNLHAVIDSGSTTAATQATAANLNAQVQGAGASGAAKAGNPVQVGGVFNTTQPTVTTGQGVEAQYTARGAAIVATGVDAFTVAGTVTTTPPSNASTNVAQVAGTTTDTNSGNKSAGTIRVVIATDQPALTNKLLVTPDSVALPANQSVNVAQINGVTPLMGAGATGTGAQRVNGVSDSATGAAPPTSAAYVGGLQSGATGGFLGGITVCDTHKPVSMTSATTTLMVTGVSGRHVRICALHLVTAIANNVAIVSGTGATCGTGTAGIAGGSTAANGYNFAANGGIAIGSGFGEVMRTVATGDSVCIITSAAGPLAGNIAYAIY